MDAIEQAHRRYERNKANRERVAAKKELMAETAVVETIPVQKIPVLLVPKEKDQDGYIEVMVRLPNREFSFTLRKRGILSNMNPSKATPAEFAKAVKAGLIPLLGATE